MTHAQPQKKSFLNMNVDLMHGPILKSLLLFMLPILVSNLFQQLYNTVDTMIVGNVLGDTALAAIGSCGSIYELLVGFGIGIGNGLAIVAARSYGAQDEDLLKRTVVGSVVIGLIASLVITTAGFFGLHALLQLLDTPAEILEDAYSYIIVIDLGVVVMFMYNLCAGLLRAIGNSVMPLVFLLISSVLNVGLDLLFVLVLRWGVSGAAAATVIAQYAAGLGLTIYALLRCRHMLPRRADFRFDRHILRELMDLSLLTCAQQSAMNFGILLIQRLVDSFGPVVMAAFAAAVKIDAFAYLPVQEFGNAFSTFSAQNYGAGQSDRLRQGLRQATAVSAAFSCAVAALVVVFARPLMGLFVQAGDTEVIACGVRYLRIEGTFYAGIGCLFLLYGFYRAVQRPGMSVVLTVVSLGTRVALAYALAGPVGEVGIWAAIPIGWFLADAAGYGYYLRHRKALLTPRAQ